MNKKKIVVLLGSTKNDSLNLKIVDYFSARTEDFFDVEIYPITNLPYFNPDLEGDLLPTSVMDFRRTIESGDGVLISTPEYVFSIPGILKNALEWTVSTVIFSEKPIAIITAASSGETAHTSIQLIMKTIGADICAVLITSPKSKMDEFGKITNDKTVKEIEDLIQKFREKIG
jgi:chromate reductase, NAD(P)H dehydrogenase (quinone)